MARREQRKDRLSAARGGLVAMSLVAAALVAGSTGNADAADAAAMKKLKVTVEGVRNNAAIPAENAFCVPAPTGHTTSGANKNPAIKWSKGPAGTQSYAIIVVDTDVPSVFDDANKEGRTIAKSLKRRDFYHMVLVDIPASETELAMGADSAGITAKGKPPGATPNGLRGVNDYSDAMSGDMAGKYGGYDGPCPPWNDEIVHHYHFIVYALDVPSLGLTGHFGGADAQAAIAKHALAKGEVVGTYTQNPALMKKGKAAKKTT
jgi:Raf kinase inhibitor-like YbhB/YbcL family protein